MKRRERDYFRISIGFNLIFLLLGTYYLYLRISRVAHLSIFGLWMTPQLNSSEPAPLTWCQKSEGPKSFTTESIARIALVGDSRIAYANWPKLKDIEFLNWGIPGDITDCALYRLPQVFQSQPTMILISLGINDLLFQRSPEQVAANIYRLVQSARMTFPKARIVLHNVLPVRESMILRKTTNDRVRDLNGLIQKMASASGIGFIGDFDWYLDSQKQLASDLTSDGVHLVARGEKRLVDTLTSFFSSNRSSFTNN